MVALQRSQPSALHSPWCHCFTPSMLPSPLLQHRPLLLPSTSAINSLISKPSPFIGTAPPTEPPALGSI